MQKTLTLAKLIGELRQQFGGRKKSIREVRTDASALLEAGQAVAKALENGQRAPAAEAAAQKIAREYQAQTVPMAGWFGIALGIRFHARSERSATQILAPFRGFPEILHGH